MVRYTKTTRQTWLNRFFYSIFGLIFAPVLVLLAFFLIKQGELEHAKTTQSLKNIYSEIDKTPQEGKLFIMCDTLYSGNDLLCDPLISLHVKTIKLFREVQTWQWTEKKKETTHNDFSGSKIKKTTYDYEEGWHSELINSDYFEYKEKHPNPKKRKYQHYQTGQGQINFGNMILGPKLYEYLLQYEPLDIRKYNVVLKDSMVIDSGSSKCLNTSLLYPNSMPRQIAGSGSAGLQSGTSKIPFSKASYSRKKEIQVNYIFTGKGTPDAPQIGDTRIIYWHIPDNQYTIIGQKQGNKITAIVRDSLFIGSKLPCNATIHSPPGLFGLISKGKHTRKKMFKQLHKENNLMFIAWRFGGFLFMIGGFALFGNPLRILLSWLPFVGYIWEKLIYKIMMLLGILTSIIISVFYFLKYNKLSNLSIYDFYFGIAILLLALLSFKLKVSAGSYHESF